VTLTNWSIRGSVYDGRHICGESIECSFTAGLMTTKRVLYVTTSNKQTMNQP